MGPEWKVGSEVKTGPRYEPRAIESVVLISKNKTSVKLILILSNKTRPRNIPCRSAVKEAVSSEVAIQKLPPLQTSGRTLFL
ncbi:hypothetical protein EVAR_93635_1 [Eumeta japonica]|uniref:Uncharacterized protein n=1 Tax=Eumeta variegata TaxID=151549 RepID=A0A4C1TQM1_EUMVA|nr:hypothetical protein EVAR_93635_1 [Eumeta japonica]